MIPDVLVRVVAVAAGFREGFAFSKGPVRPGGVPAVPDWGMRRELMSQSFTTRINELWSVN